MYKLINVKGYLDYKEGLKIQQKAYKKVYNDEYDGIVYFLQHKPVFTIGISGKEDNLLVDKHFLKEKSIELIPVDRGGDITFHGPGQIVVYPVMNIRKIKQIKNSVKKYVEKLENVVTETLKEYGIEGYIREGYIGVWVQDMKIAAFGSKVTKGVSSHGLAMNITVEKNFFEMINPCGIKEYGICSLNDFIPEISFDEVIEKMICNFEKEFLINFTEVEEFQF